MTWQIALFLSIIFGTFRGFFDKKLVEKINPYLAFLYTSFWGTILLILLYFLRHQSLPPIYPEAMLLGNLYNFVLIAWLSAIKISLSQSTIFSSFYLVISLIMAAVFLGEWQLFNPLQFSGIKNILGMIIAISAIWLFFKTNSKKEEKLERKWIIFMGINVILNGIGTFWSKVVLMQHGPLEILISQSIGALPVLFIINILRGSFKRKDAKINYVSLFDAVSVVLAAAFYYVAVKQGNLIIVLPVQTLGLSFLVALTGLIFYKEKNSLNKQQLLGLVVGFIGIAILVIQ